jgi:uncharacterized protein (TIGR02246 family)
VTLFTRVLLSVLFLLISVHARAAEHPQSVPEQLNPLLEEMLSAANAHDTNRFMAAYITDESLIVTFDDMTMRGWKAVRDQQFEWWNGGKSDAVYSLRSAPEIKVIDPDVAATLQSMDVSSTGPNGVKSTVSVVATSIWKKLPEGWRIVLAHESLIQ